MVRALASHHCGPGSNPSVNAICGLSFSFAPRGFSLGTPVPPLLKNQHFLLINSKFQFDQGMVNKDPLQGCATSKPLFDCAFLVVIELLIKVRWPLHILHNSSF